MLDLWGFGRIRRGGASGRARVSGRSATRTHLSGRASCLKKRTIARE